MQEGRAIALWTVLLGGGFIGAIWLMNDPPKFGATRPVAPASRPVPVLPSPMPAQPAVPQQSVSTVPAVEPPAAPPPRAAVTPAEPPAPVIAPSVAPSPSLPPAPVTRAPAEPRSPPLVPTPPPAPAVTAARPAPDFPVIPPGPKSGDNAEARRYTDALNALSTEGYSGVDRIVPEGDQFRATAIMEGQRFEVLVDPDSGQVWRLSRPR